jgi:hypothetical protein
LKSGSNSVTCAVCGMMYATQRILHFHRRRVHTGMHIFLIAHDVTHVIEVMSYMNKSSDVAHVIEVMSYMDT